jgi:hypothetical protein
MHYVASCQSYQTSGELEAKLSLYYNIFLCWIADTCSCSLLLPVSKFIVMLYVCSPKQMGVSLQVCMLQHYGLIYISCLGLHCPRLMSSKAVGASRKWHYQNVRLGAKTLANGISGLNEATHSVSEDALLSLIVLYHGPWTDGHQVHWIISMKDQTFILFTWQPIVKGFYHCKTRVWIQVSEDATQPMLSSHKVQHSFSAILCIPSSRMVIWTFMYVVCTNVQYYKCMRILAIL